MRYDNDAANRWFQTGREQGATHLLVILDTVDYEYFPIYVFHGQDIESEKQAYNRMSRIQIHATFDLSQDIEDKLQ